jgi:hypothetical protein
MNEKNLSPVLVSLLRGVLYRDQHPRLWQDLLALEGKARDYLAVLGLTLELDEAEGFALLRQVENEEDPEAIPRLVARRPLSYPVSLLLVLLRKRLLEGDAAGGETRTVVTRADLVEQLRVFLPERSNEVRIMDQIDAHINRVVDLGFLKELGEPGVFEVRRILKAFVDAQWLSDFSSRLESYRAHARPEA